MLQRHLSFTHNFRLYIFVLKVEDIKLNLNIKSDPQKMFLKSAMTDKD